MDELEPSPVAPRPGDIMLPVVKGAHCRTTHYACDCVLERLAQLEKLADALDKCDDAHARCLADNADTLAEGEYYMWQHALVEELEKYRARRKKEPDRG